MLNYITVQKNVRKKGFTKSNANLHRYCIIIILLQYQIIVKPTCKQLQLAKISDHSYEKK